MGIFWVYLLLLSVAVLYAVALDFAESRWRLVSNKTWLMVVIGNAIILASMLFVVTLDEWVKFAIANAVAGLPIVARSLRREVLHQRQVEEFMNECTNSLAEKLRELQD